MENPPAEWEAAKKALEAIKTTKAKPATQNFNYTEGVATNAYTPLMMPYVMPSMMMGAMPGAYNPYFPYGTAMYNPYQIPKPVDVKPPSLYNDKTKFEQFPSNPIIVDTAKEPLPFSEPTSNLSKFNVNMLKAALKSKTDDKIIKRPLLSVKKNAGKDKNNPSNYPPALRDYVNKCLTTLKDEKALNKVKDIIAKAFQDGTVWTKDWSKEPMPSLFKPTLSPMRNINNNNRYNNHNQSGQYHNNRRSRQQQQRKPFRPPKIYASNESSENEEGKNYDKDQEDADESGAAGLMVNKKSLYLPPKGEPLPSRRYRERKRKDYYFYGDRRRKKEGGRGVKGGPANKYKSFLGTTPVFKAPEKRHEDGTLVNEYVSASESSSSTSYDEDGVAKRGSRSSYSGSSSTGSTQVSGTPSNNGSAKRRRRPKRGSSQISGSADSKLSQDENGSNDSAHKKRKHKRQRDTYQKQNWQRGYGKRSNGESFYNDDLNADTLVKSSKGRGKNPNVKFRANGNNENSTDRIFAAHQYPGGENSFGNPHSNNLGGNPNTPGGGLYTKKNRPKFNKNGNKAGAGLTQQEAFKLNQGEVEANKEVLERRTNRFKLNEEQELLGRRLNKADALGNVRGGPNNFVNRFNIMGIQGNENLDDSVDAGANIDWTKIHVVGTSTNLERPYLRLTSAPDPEIIRPAPILYKSLLLVQSKWCSEHNYHYACEQLKSIRQDLIVQNIRDSLTVAVYETHCRIALEMADREEFNQCQTQLQALYEEGQTSKFKEEFIAYQIIYHMFTNSSIDLNITLGNISPDIAHNPMIQFVTHLHSAWSLGNYHKFFKLYSKKALRMSAYLIDWFIVRERKLAIEKIIRAYKQAKLPLTFLVNELAFSDEEACKEFIRSLHLSFTPQDEMDGQFDCKLNCTLVK